MIVSDEGIFRSLLFGDKDLEDIPVAMERYEWFFSDRTWSDLRDLQLSVTHEKREKLMQRLRFLRDSCNATTLARLFANYNLYQSIGTEQVDTGLNALQGVVVEVRVKEGIDTLAVYNDMSARYINHGGKMILWDAGDSEIESLCSRVMVAAAQTSSFAKKHYIEEPQTRLLRITLLTFSGNYRLESDPAHSNVSDGSAFQLFQEGARLMRELINKSSSITPLPLIRKEMSQ